MWLRSNSILRLFGIALVALISGLASPALYIGVLYATAIAHFLLSIYYSRGRLRRFPSSGPMAWLALAVVIAMAVLGFPPLSIYFGLHFAFSEFYLFAPRPSGASSPTSLFSARLLLNLALYLYLIRGVAPLNLIPSAVCIGVLAATALWCAFSYFKRLGSMSRFEALDLALFELMGVALVLGLGTRSLHTYHMIFYHVLVWILISLRMPSVQLSKRRFLVEHGALMGFFFLLMPVVGFVPYAAYGVWTLTLNVVGSFHVGLSFLTSDSNPMWLRRLVPSSARSV